MLYTFIKKIKHCSAYILILFGMFYGIQTAPSGLYKILYQFNIKNRIGLDLTDCSSFTFSIIKTDFFFPLFLLSLFSVLVGILLLCRKRVFIIQYNYYNLGFLLLFLLAILFNLGFFIYIYLLMIEDSLFNKHIIYTISFSIACLACILYFTLCILIWFDKTLSLKWKTVYFILLFFLSIDICYRLLSFIHFYGILGDNPDIFSDAFNNILIKLNLGVFCMEQNPCEPLYKEMQRYCNFARSTKAIPRIPVGGGTPSTIWIARIMNIFGTTTKYKAQDFCNDSRESYKKCLEMFGFITKI